MPNVNDLSESKYLAKEDVGAGLLVTISGYRKVDMSRESDPQQEWKYVLEFNECKPLVLNKTNGQLIQIFTGTGDFDGWIGKQITLFNDQTVSFAGKITGGIRVLIPQGYQPPSSNPTPTQQVNIDRANAAMGGRVEDTTDYGKENIPF